MTTQDYWKAFLIGLKANNQSLMNEAMQGMARAAQ